MSGPINENALQDEEIQEVTPPSELSEASPSSLRIEKLTVVAEPDFDSPEVQKILEYNRDKLKQDLEVIETSEPVELGLLPVRVTYWKPGSTSDKSGRFGFVEIPSVAGAPARSAFVHFSDIKTASSEKLGPGDDLKGQTFYVDESAIVPGRKQGELRIDSCVTTAAYERALEKANKAQTENHAKRLEELEDKLHRAENTAWLVGHWGEAQALLLAGIQQAADFHQLHVLELPLEDLQGSLKATRVTSVNDGSRNVEIDPVAGPTSVGTERFRVEFGKEGQRPGALAGANITFEIEEKGWKYVVPDKQGVNFAPVDFEGGRMEVPFINQRVRGARVCRCWFPVSGDAPDGSVIKGEVYQRLTAKTPVGDATALRRVYHPFAREQVPVVGEFEKEYQALRNQVDMEYLEKNSVSEQLVKMIEEGGLAGRLSSLASTVEAAAFYRELEQLAGDIFILGGETEQTMCKEVLEILEAVSLLMSPDYDLVVKSHRQVTGYSRPATRWDADGQLNDSSPIYSGYDEIVLESRVPGSANFNFDLGDELSTLNEVFVRTQPPKRATAKGAYLEDRAELIRVLIKKRVEKVQALYTKPQINRLQDGLAAAKSSIFSTIGDSFDSDLALSNLQERLLEERVSGQERVEARMEELRTRYNLMLKTGINYIHPDFKAYEKLYCTEESAKSVLPVVEALSREFDRFRSYRAGDISYEKFRSGFAQVEGPIGEGGLTTLEHRLRDAEALVRKYDALVAQGYKVRHIISPHRSRGSTEYSVEIIQADGIKQKPDFTEETLRHQKEPPSRRYDIVDPSSLEVAFQSSSHGGQQPGEAFSARIELPKGKLTEQQIDAIVECYFVEGSVHLTRMRAGDFTKDKMRAELIKALAVATPDGEITQIDFSGFSGTNKQPKYELNVSSYPPYNSQAPFTRGVPPFVANNATMVNEGPGDVARERGGGEVTEKAAKSRRFIGLVDGFDDEDLGELAAAFSSPTDRRFSGDVTQREAAVVSCVLRAELPELVTLGLGVPEIDTAIKRVNVLSKQAETTRDPEAAGQLTEYSTTLERRRAEIQKLLQAEATIRDYTGTDEDAHRALVLKVAKRLTEIPDLEETVDLEALVLEEIDS